MGEMQEIQVRKVDLSQKMGHYAMLNFYCIYQMIGSIWQKQNICGVLTRTNQVCSLQCSLKKWVAEVYWEVKTLLQGQEEVDSEV